MNGIRELYQKQKELGEDRLATAAIFPDYFNTANNKYKILFIQPKINRFQLFTMITPALMLNAHSQTITTLITGMEPDKKELDTDTEQIVFHTDDVKMAHAIVLPFSDEDLTQKRIPTPENPDGLSVYEEIRKINPIIKIVYAVDFNFYDVPKSHYNYKRIHSNLICIEDNIRKADYVLVANEELPKLLMQKLRMPGIRAIHIPSYFALPHFADIDFTNPTESPQWWVSQNDKVRIGIPADMFRREDIEYWKPTYLWLQNTFKDKVEIVYYGTHPSKDILLTDKREGKIDNKSLYPKLSGRQKPEYYTGYYRQKRNDYQYHFKNFFNLNLDLCLFLTKSDSDFWRYSPIDVDLLYAMYAQVPIMSTRTLAGYPDFNIEANVRSYLKDFITELTKTRRLSINVYKQSAESLGKMLVSEVCFNEPNFQIMEAQFLAVVQPPKKEESNNINSNNIN